MGAHDLALHYAEVVAQSMAKQLLFSSWRWSYWLLLPHRKKENKQVPSRLLPHPAVPDSYLMSQFPAYSRLKAAVTHSSWDASHRHSSNYFHCPYDGFTTLSLGTYLQLAPLACSPIGAWVEGPGHALQTHVSQPSPTLLGVGLCVCVRFSLHRFSLSVLLVHSGSSICSI